MGSSATISAGSSAEYWLEYGVSFSASGSSGNDGKCDQLKGNGTYYAVLTNDSGDEFSSLDNTVNQSVTVAWQEPSLTLDGKTGSMNIYSCVGGVDLKQNPVGSTYCGDDAIVWVRELGVNFAGSIGPLITRTLNSTEFNIMQGDGFDLNSCDDGTNIVSFEDGHYYTVIVAVNPGWQKRVFYFQYHDKDFDLVMEDFPGDLGIEPSDYTKNVFKSKDLWNKLSTNIYNTSHDNPDMVTVSGNENRMYAQIRNRGCDASPSSELRFYWTRARTDELWPLHWNYNDPLNFVVDASSQTNPPATVAAGAEITIQNPTNLDYNKTKLTNGLVIPSILSGATYPIVTSFSTGQGWFPPNPAWYGSANGQMSTPGQGNHPIICLLASLSAVNDPISHEPSSGNMLIEEYVRMNNNVVTLNTLLVNNSGFMVINPVNDTRDYGWATVMVNNARGSTQTAGLHLTLNGDPTLFTTFNSSGGILYLGMDDDLWNVWSQSSFAGTGFTIIENGLIQVTSLNVSLLGLQLPAEEVYSFGLKFEYPMENNELYDSSLLMDWTLRQYYDSLESYGSDVIVRALVYDAPYYEGEDMFVPTSTNNPTIDSLKVNVYPNPFGNSLVVAYEIFSSEELSVELYDMQGKLVAEILAPKFHSLGKYTVTFPSQNLENGMYLVTLNAGKRRLTERVVSLKK